MAQKTVVAILSVDEKLLDGGDDKCLADTYFK